MGSMCMCWANASNFLHRYVPNTNTLARFLWVVGVLVRNDFIVMLDNHLNTDNSIMLSQSQWLQVRTLNPKHCCRVSTSGSRCGI